MLALRSEQIRLLPGIAAPPRPSVSSSPPVRRLRIGRAQYDALSRQHVAGRVGAFMNAHLPAGRLPVDDAAVMVVVDRASALGLRTERSLCRYAFLDLLLARHPSVMSSLDTLLWEADGRADAEMDVLFAAFAPAERKT